MELITLLYLAFLILYIGGFVVLCLLVYWMFIIEKTDYHASQRKRDTIIKEYKSQVEELVEQICVLKARE